MGQLKWLALSAIILIADFVTKQWVEALFYLGQQKEILPVFNLTLAYNRGAAFSFLHDAGGWQRWFFVIVAMGISVVLVLWLRRLNSSQTLLAIGLASILGGAVGNLIDRLWLGYVIDFIQVHWQNNYFPSFNIADSAVTIGAMLLILDAILNPESSEKKQ